MKLVTSILFLIAITTWELGCSTPQKPYVRQHIKIPDTTLSLSDWVRNKLKTVTLPAPVQFRSEEILQKWNESMDPNVHFRISELNVMGVFGKADYSVHYSELAVKKCIDLIKKYPNTFRRAEQEFAVDKETIAALLWVETKHGKHFGKEDVLETYLKIAVSDHPKTLSHLFSKLDLIPPSRLIELENTWKKGVEEKVKDRAELKSQWAVSQIQAIGELYEKGLHSIIASRGSFAGAMGAAQFIPSSILKYGFSHAWRGEKTWVKEPAPNLFDMKDAILSVAQYLSTEGYHEENLESQKNALFHYNRIQAYGDVILKIREEIKKSTQNR